MKGPTGSGPVGGSRFMRRNPARPDGRVLVLGCRSRGDTRASRARLTTPRPSRARGARAHVARDALHARVLTAPLLTFWRFIGDLHRWIPLARAMDGGSVVGLRNRRSEVRILSGALQKPCITGLCYAWARAREFLSPVLVSVDGARGLARQSAQAYRSPWPEPDFGCLGPEPGRPGLTSRSVTAGPSSCRESAVPSISVTWRSSGGSATSRSKTLLRPCA
jgi:hypothetical protein